MQITGTPADYELMSKVITVLKPFKAIGRNATVSLVIPVKLIRELTLISHKIPTKSLLIWKVLESIQFRPFLTFKSPGFRSKVKAHMAKSKLISDMHEETRGSEPDNQ